MPPIWGFDCGDIASDEKAVEVEAILYSAGPVLLDQLATRISHERFLAWCRELKLREVRFTAHALDVLRLLEGEQAAIWLENRLRGGDG